MHREYRGARGGKGLIAGLARHYREPVLVSEPACVLRGAPSCRITVTQRR
jgi:hypothetical protein